MYVEQKNALSFLSFFAHFNLLQVTVISKSADFFVRAWGLDQIEYLCKVLEWMFNLSTDINAYMDE